MKLKALIVFIILVANLSISKTYFKNRNNDDDRIFERLLHKIMEIDNIPSISAAIVKNNRAVWAKGFGLYDIERNKLASNKTIYLIASITKPFTATAIMQLHEKGLLDIDDDVNKYLPFPLRNPNYPGKPITIRMLLAHQSSLAEDPLAFYCYFPGDLEIKGYPYPWLKEYLLPQGIHYKPQIWADYPPGEEMSYANIGYSILGYIVELVTNMTFYEYCNRYIFKPLEMENTSFKLNDLNISQIAVPYEHGQPLLHYSILDYPAGGLRTNVIDLSHFLIAHMNKGKYKNVSILGEDSINEMHRVQYPSKKYGFEYGLGFQIWKIGGEKYIGHTGGLYGVATKMVYRESDKVGIIFFMNKGVNNLRDIIAFSLIERLLFWKAEKEKLIRMKDIEETINANMHLIKKYGDVNKELRSFLSEIGQKFYI